MCSSDLFATQVETRPPTAEEIAELRRVAPHIVQGDKLTNHTYSLAMDIGMYWGEMLIKNLAGTHWDQRLKNPRDVNYGQPVVVGKGKVPLNPVTVCVGIAFGIANRKKTGAWLPEMYATWVKNLMPG